MPYLISAGLFVILLVWSVSAARAGNLQFVCLLTPTMPLFLIVPFLFQARRSSRTPFPHAHCQRCGYDLTANVSGRCPECGAFVGVTRDTIRELHRKSWKHLRRDRADEHEK